MSTNKIISRPPPPMPAPVTDSAPDTPPLGSQSATLPGLVVSAQTMPGDDPQALPWMLNVVYHSPKELQSSFMPFIAGGGIFIPTQASYELGDSLFVIVQLPGEERRYPVTGQVAWISPANAVRSRQQGVGIAFPTDHEGSTLREAIEEQLKKVKGIKAPSYTL